MRALGEAAADLTAPDLAERGTGDLGDRGHPPHPQRLTESVVDLYGDLRGGLAPLAGLPASHILVAEYDDLRPSGELLHRQLGVAGVASTLDVASGLPHGFLNRAPSLAAVDRSLDRIAETLRGTGA